MYLQVLQRLTAVIRTNAGANVDGREIYAVFSTDSSYTDTTDNADKLAYEVHAGAADWDRF